MVQISIVLEELSHRLIGRIAMNTGVRSELGLPLPASRMKGLSLPSFTGPVSLALTVAFIAVLVWGAALSYYGSFYRGWDAQLYYAHLRSACLDHDFNATNEITELTPGAKVFEIGAPWGGLPTTDDGQLVNIYTVGSPLMGLPGFAAGHLIALANGTETDGYSRPYEFAVTLWYALLVAIACGILGSAIAPWTGPRSAWFAVLAVFLGTNVLYYTSVLPMMNHGPSFVVMSVLTWLALRLYREPDRVWMWRAVAIAVFMLVLVRPTDAVMMIILLPPAIKVMKTGWRPSVAYGLPVVLAVFAAAGVQILVWRAAFGRWVLNSYSEWTNVGFDFSNSMLWSLLFSGEGALLYHPLFAIGFIGLVLACCLVRGSDRWVWVALTAGLVLHIGLYSFWASWSSGESFGNRIFVNSAPLGAFGLAYLLHLVRRRIVIVASAGVLALLILSNTLLTAGFVTQNLPPRETADLPALLNAQWQLLTNPKMADPQ